MNDKRIENKVLINKICNSESKVMKRKQLYKKQMKKQNQIMNKIKATQNKGDYQLSEDSSDLEEFITNEDFKMFYGRQNDIEELEEVKQEGAVLKQKQKCNDTKDEKSKIQQQKQSLKRLLRMSLL